VILERRKSKNLSRLALARFANQAQRAAGLSGEVNILLTGDAEMQRLNLQFRHKDTPTDVLSFPAERPQPERRPLPRTPERPQPERRPLPRTRRAETAMGGDIAISLQTARLQAAAAGHDLLTEVKVLILHGMLHLAGHDHETDRGQMRRLEQKLRAEFHLDAGLIERTVPARARRK
jgi:probable rRNA maturation factor